MKPFYDRGGITVYCGDVHEAMRAIRLSEVGCVVADPPYGEPSLAWDTWPDNWPNVVGALVPMTAPLWCFGSMRMFVDKDEEFRHWRMAQDLVWEKHNGSNFHADRFRRVHEHAVQWYRGPWEDVWKTTLFTPDATARQVRRKQRPAHTGSIGASSYESEDGGPRMMRSVLKVRSCHGRAVHPTQKPEGIVEPLLRYSAAPGKVVLDLFSGSGTTLVVAKSMGMRAVGIEADPEWCEEIAKRLTQEIGWAVP